MRGGRARLAWVCICDCNPKTTCIRVGQDLGARTNSCGCLQPETNTDRLTTHGRSGSPTHKTWCSIIQRCTNSKNPNWKDYGGRGIGICDRWRNSFESFLTDMGERPYGMTIERRNNNGNYEPGNCVWASRDAQGRNRRTCKLTEDLANEALGRMEHGETAASVAKRLNVSAVMVSRIRLRKSWTNLRPFAGGALS